MVSNDMFDSILEQFGEAEQMTLEHYEDISSSPTFDRYSESTINSQSTSNNSSDGNSIEPIFRKNKYCMCANCQDKRYEITFCRKI